MTELLDPYQILEILKRENINLPLDDFGHLSDFISGVKIDCLLQDKFITENDIYFQDNAGSQIKQIIINALNHLRIKTLNKYKNITLEESTSLALQNKLF